MLYFDEAFKCKSSISKINILIAKYGGVKTDKAKISGKEEL